MLEPSEQDLELLMLITGATRAEALRDIARAAAEWELLRQRAMAGDSVAITEYREMQRELARILARAQARNEAVLAGLCALAKEGTG